MNLSQVIERLQGILEAEGDLPVCVTEPHEYWGDLYYHIGDAGISVCTDTPLEGPKSHEVVKAVIINRGF